MQHGESIDFILTWVDGSDPDWRKEYNKYSGVESTGDKKEIRFRDFDLLRFWFRGVEKFSPWVNKIHFVTCGHIPGWLNTSHPKLNFVTHEDYIPEQYLPTFNSHVIELNLHRIKNLSDNFVYFNDDLFITNNLPQNYFFKHSIPNDCAILNAITPGGISHIVMNCVEVINKHFCKNTVINNNKLKWFHPSYGINLLRSIALMPWPNFIGFKDTHLPIPYQKKTFTDVWDLEFELLDESCKSKFRDDHNINQYLIRYWQLVEGNFSPKNTMKKTCYTDFNSHTIDSICSLITSQSNDILIINDADVDDFNLIKSKLTDAFNYILPEKCSFEK